MSCMDDDYHEQERTARRPTTSRPTIDEMSAWPLSASDPTVCWTRGPEPSHVD